MARPAKLEQDKPDEGLSQPSKQSSLPPPLDKKEPRERVAVVKKLAGGGPDAQGAIPTLMMALEDDDRFVKGFAAVALISFGEKARPALERKHKERERMHKEKMKELDDLGAIIPGKPAAPNPKPAPEGWLGPVDFLVSGDPWFAGTIKPMSLLALRDSDPDFRAVGAKALGFLEGGHPTPDPDVVEALEAARDDPHEQVQSAAKQALKMLRR
ncbi:MAG TPA: HEAT repeat domain-containing protein [Gemmataceae bacterium]|nr:HEAT repeat domain-containing protein [Gemmataceae bacterium]